MHFYLVKYFYDYDIDYAVVNALFKYNYNVSQRRLNWIIQAKEFLNKTIPEKSFRYHIRNLLSHNYVYELKENWQRGQSSPLHLTSTTHEQIRLKTLVIQYNGNNKDREKENLNSYRESKKRLQETQQRAEVELKRRMIYYIIFRVMSIDTPNRNYKHNGLSVTDIMNARYDGHAFYYLRLEKDRSTVEECIRKLQDENIVVEIRIDGQEYRYMLVERLWKNFVKDCSILEGDIMLRSYLVWQNIRKPKPEERLYQEYCWGERSANGRMNKVCKTLEGNRTKHNHPKHRAEIKELIECLDSNIAEYVRELRQKYHDLIKRYTWTCNEIINTVYPEFIQTEVEQINKNEKTKYKKYPKLQRVFTSDVLEFRDSVEVSQSTVAETK